MTARRYLGLLATTLAGVLVVLLARRHTARAQQLARAGRAVSRRIVDREARDSAAMQRWDNEGGATKGSTNAAIR
jgi:hypothetical protein